MRKKKIKFRIECRLYDWALPLAIGWWNGCQFCAHVQFLCFAFVVTYNWRSPECL